jgi:endonuclease-3
MVRTRGKAQSANIKAAQAQEDGKEMSRNTGGEKGAAQIKRRGVKQPDPRDFTYGSLEHILYVLTSLDAVYMFSAMPEDELATGEPLDGLILTLLSQNTNDRNRDMAYNALRARFPTWRGAAESSADEIARLIRPAGLGDTKSSRMMEILRKISEDFGEYSLVKMYGMTQGEVKSYLSALPGIGPKTVACVMAFDLGMPSFPVDTHVARISRRLGWVAEKAAPEKIQDFLEATVPPEYHRWGHLGMIEHGRRTCRARRPDCAVCAVKDVCPAKKDDTDG